MNKAVILNLIKKGYPNADYIHIDLSTNHLRALCTTDSSKDETGVAPLEPEHLQLLSDFYSVKNLREVGIDVKKKEIKFIGDTTKII